MRKLVLFSASFAAACAVYVYWLSDHRLLWAAGGLLALSLLPRKRVRLAALGAAVGILWCFCYQQIFLAPALNLCQTEQTLTVTLQEPWQTTQYGTSAEVRLSVDGHSYSAVLYMDQPLSDCAPGDQLTGRFRVEPSSASNDKGESLYLRSGGTMLCLYSQSLPEIIPGNPSPALRLRLRLQDRIAQLYEGETAGFLNALLTGDRQGLSYRTRNELSVAGISHAVAVSGMHVSILLAMLAFLFGGNPRLTAMFGIPILFLYAVMTGASPSVCRAAAMQLLLLLAPLVRRESDTPTSLAAAGLVLLLENPWSIANVSFQLSFAAVAGLALFAGPIQARILSFGKGRILRFVAASVSASLSASLLTLPLTVFYFSMVSVAAPLTNLLVLWAVTGVFTMGLLSCLLGPLGTLLAVPVHLLSQGILLCCRFIAAFPYSAAYPQNFSYLFWGLGAYPVAALLLLCRKLRGKCWYLSGMTLLLLASLVSGRWKLLHNKAVFTAVDVGQGQCLLWQAGDFTAVIDCGGNSAEVAGETAARTLHSAGLTQVDAVILTHYDLDHCGGVPQLLNRVQADHLILPDTEAPLRQQLIDEAAVHGTSVSFLREEAVIAAEGTTLRLLPAKNKKSGNEGSLCVLATASEYDILITGDRSGVGELELLSQYKLPAVELLVAGHHGAGDSTSSYLLKHLTPETAVISVGENAHGHPAAETLSRLQQAGVRVLRTDQDGTIVIPIS